MFYTGSFNFSCFYQWIVLIFFSEKCEFCYFADDNSLYSCGMSLDYIFNSFTQNTLNVYQWLVYNSMKANSDQFQFMILTNTDSHTLQIGDITTRSVWSLTLLGITIDSKLNFKENINNIIKSIYNKLYAQRRLRKFLT